MHDIVSCPDPFREGVGTRLCMTGSLLTCDVPYGGRVFLCKNMDRTKIKHKSAGDSTEQNLNSMKFPAIGTTIQYIKSL